MKIKKVLVSQPKPTTEKSPYFDIAEKYGVKIDFRPFIKVESLSAKEFRQQKVSILDHTAVVFTSRHAIDHFFSLCAELRVTIPETMKYFCTSETIALYIQKYVQYRKRKVFFGATGKFADLLPQIIKHNTEKYFIPMSDVHNDEVKDLLDKNHIQHTEAVMYRTVSNDFTPEEEFNYDMLIFFSPAGIQSLMKNFPNFEQKDIAIGSFGPTTAKAVKDAGLRLDFGSSFKCSSFHAGSVGYVYPRTQQIKIILTNKAKQSIFSLLRFVSLYTLYERFSKINLTESRTTEQPDSD